MKSNRIILIAPVTFLFVILLSACGNISDESITKEDNLSHDSSTSPESPIIDSTESASNVANSNTYDNTNEQEDTSKIKDEAPPTNNTKTSLKDRYLKKLQDTKNETEELEAIDSSTFALKKVENDRWDIWDALLNDIYGVLKVQLPSEEMDLLREEQRNWLTYRDDRALEASKKYKGGTQEHLEYVVVLKKLTAERCYELVEDYM